MRGFAEIDDCVSISFHWLPALQNDFGERDSGVRGNQRGVNSRGILGRYDLREVSCWQESCRRDPQESTITKRIAGGNRVDSEQANRNLGDHLGSTFRRCEFWILCR